MCEKCDAKRKALQAVIDKDPAFTEDDKIGAGATLLMMGLESILDSSMPPPSPAKLLMMVDRAVSMALAKKAKQLLEDPKVKEMLDVVMGDLESQLQERVLENMPVPKVTH